MIEVKILSEKRWNHCCSVAQYGYMLANYWGVVPLKAYLAGIFHDIAREMPIEELVNTAKCYGIEISEAEKKTPILLHSGVSAIIARVDYGIADKEILSAIEKHTLGHEHMTNLEKIIYLADKIEPLRNYDGVTELRSLAMENLDAALSAVIKKSIKYLEDAGVEPNPRTIAMNNNLLRGVLE